MRVEMYENHIMDTRTNRNDLWNIRYLKIPRPLRSELSQIKAVRISYDETTKIVYLFVL